MEPHNNSEGNAKDSTIHMYEAGCSKGRVENIERNPSRSPLLGARTQDGQLVSRRVGVNHQTGALNFRKTGDVAGNTPVRDLTRRPEEADMWADDVHLVVETLRWGSDQTSIMLLARLRMGLSVGNLAQSIRAEAAASIGTHS